MTRNNSTEKIGVIVSDKPPSLTRALIKLSTSDVRPLEYVVSYFKENDERIGVILRITDIKQYSETSYSRVLDVEEKTNIKITPITETPIGEYLIAEAEVIDAFKISSDNKVKPLGSVKVPKTRGEVYRADNNLIRALIGEVKHKIRIGKLYGTDVDVFLEANSFTRHMIILGGTGSGKSWFRGILMEELKELEVPQINFDVLNEYSRAVKQLGGKNLRLGKDFKPRLDSLTADVFDIMIEPYIPTPFQRAIARQGFIEYKRDSKQAVTPLQPSDLLNYVNQAAYAYNARDDTRLNTVTRLEAFLQDYDIFGPSIDWNGIIEKHKLVNITFGYPNEGIIRVGIAATLMELMELREKGVIKPFIVSFDEAHTIIPRGKVSPASAVIKRLLRYGRHLGIGVIMITQRPSSIDDEAVGMPATRAIFSLDARELKETKYILGDLGDYIFNLIPRLESGTAVLTSTMDIMRHSIYVRIREDRRTEHGGKTPDLIS